MNFFLFNAEIDCVMKEIPIYKVHFVRYAYLYKSVLKEEQGALVYEQFCDDWNVQRKCLWICAFVLHSYVLNIQSFLV